MQTANIASHSYSKLLDCLWKLNLPPIVKIFNWLLICERLKTRQRLHSFTDSIPANCVFCTNHEESLDQLFMQCDFAKHIWTITALPSSPLHWDMPFVQWLDSLNSLLIMKKCYLKSLPCAINFGKLGTSTFSTIIWCKLSTLCMLQQSHIISTFKQIRPLLESSSLGNATLIGILPHSLD